MSYRDEAPDEIARGTWTAWRVFWALFWFTFLTSMVGMIVAGLYWAVTTPAGVVQRVTQPEIVIERYEWFESQVADVKAADEQIAAAQKAIDRFKEEAGPRSGWKFDERQEYARLTETHDGLEFYRSRLVADYNAKSRMITRSLWKRRDLPYDLK
jgi:hypothetical protein